MLIIGISLCLLSCFAEASEHSVYPFVWVQSGGTCSMYANNFCKIPLLIREDIDLREIKLASDQQSAKFYQLIKIEECDHDRILIDECRNETFSLVEKNLTAHYKRAYIFVNAILVGRGFLFFNYSDIHVRYPIVVSGPDRFIDRFQKVYVVIFQFVISLLMGLLIELKTVLKILKKPVPVLVGFFCQYLFMPLVIVLICFSRQSICSFQASLFYLSLPLLALKFFQ
jgi:hypothetical protein